MKTRYILYPLLMLLAMLLPTSCSLEEDLMEVAASSNGDKITFNMGVSVPGASNVQSRGFAEGDTYSNNEEYFKSTNLHIAVFEISSTGTFLKEFVSADLLKETDSDEDNDGCTNFRVTLTQAGGVNKSYRLHVIANYPGLELKFDNEVQLMSSLAADGANHDVYWNFVELERIDESSLEKLCHVPLVRNYAKISLNLPSNLGSFAFTGYKLYNVPKRGTVAAYNPNATSKFTQFVAKDDKGNYIPKDYATIIGENYVGNEPYNDGSLYGETGWITIPEEETAIPSTYMYERRQTDASGTPVSNTTYMIIQGTWDGKPAFYKLDFVDNSSGKYYNLLRNFHYTMTVSEITGPGYTTENEAMRQPACNNISASAELKDFTNISNGESQLYVSTTYVMFTNNTPIDIYYKYIPDLDVKVNGVPQIINTIGSTGVSISCEQKDEPVLESASPANTDVNDTNSQYSGWRKVTLTPVETVPGSPRLQKVTISAGGLSRTIELDYRAPIEGMQVVVNENQPIFYGLKEEVPVKITLPTGIPESLFPLRLFITSADNTIFPVYSENMPAEVQNFKNGNTIISEYGFIKEVSYSNAYDVEYNEDDEKIETPKTIECNFLTSKVKSATTVSVRNLYLDTAGDDFQNKNVTSLTIANGHTVSIQTEYKEFTYNRRTYTTTVYPKAINHSNNNNTIGNNNGAENVEVAFNKETKNITISRSQVTSNDITFTNTNGFDIDAQLEFTFNDYYCSDASYGRSWTVTWSRSTVEYTATCTVEDLLNGVPLDFKRPNN